MNLFIQLLFGHFLGDFFFQPKSMAVKKGASNKIAIYHVLIYSACVFWMTMPCFNWHNSFGCALWYVVIFIPHFVIDRWSLADKWLDFINGRSLNDFLWNGNDKIPQYLPKGKVQTELTTDNELNYIILRGGFTSIVYVVVDNVAHLMCLWYGFNLIFKA